jgi:hypothetical protein
MFRGLSENFYKSKYKGIQNEKRLLRLDQNNQAKQELRLEALNALNDSKLSSGMLSVGLISPKSLSPMSMYTETQSSNFFQTSIMSNVLFQKLK